MKQLITLLAISTLLFSCQKRTEPISTEKDEIKGRLAWETMRLADPETGEIPLGIRKQELAFAANLPSDLDINSLKNTVWKKVGPYNIGGRTRAAAIDVTNDSIIIAGGVSGGMWRSEDMGQTWENTLSPDSYFGATCLVQDSRPGKTNIWYYGSGEGIGNSASKSFSAYYLGNGMYKSTDGGRSWNPLTSTQNDSPEKRDAWDIMWNVKVDPSIDTADVVYAAILGRIMRSWDGGQTWEIAIGTNSGFLAEYTDIAITSSGVKYATFSNDGDINGIFRSEDGDTWTKIQPDSFPKEFERIVMAIDPTNENKVYFLTHTEDGGKKADPTDLGSERNALWKYVYKSGNGADSGGVWTDLSPQLPSDESWRRNYRAQGNYNMVVAVHETDSNLVYIAGTNMFRSTDAFATSQNITQIGGYNPGQTSTFEYRYPKSHPDFHVIDFFKDHPNKVFTANDGGCYYSENAYASTVEWVDINRGMYTTQFYTIALDHQTTGSQVVVGGMQDNSSAWTNTNDPTKPWTIPSGGDGSFCAVGNGGEDYYFSSQNGRTYKMELDADGERLLYRRIDPDGGSVYLFVNPFILDAANHNIMYMAEYTRIWRHDDLASIPLDATNSKLDVGWESIEVNFSGERVSALESSTTNPEHLLYIGTTEKNLYVLENADTATSVPKKITQNLGTGTYVSDIAVDPRNGRKAIVVYSNYNAYSLYYTEDAGKNWEKIGGNLEPDLDPTLPSFLDGQGTGPSCRSAAILYVENKPVYFIGTSTGLYATKNLNGDSTEWVKQGSQTIGNAIVDMIDVRQSDGFIALGTHGNGVYTAFINSLNQVVGIDDLKNKNKTDIQVSVFPNPAKDHIRFNGLPDEALGFSLNVYNLSGQQVLSAKNLNPQSKVSTSMLPAGYYSFSLRSNSATKSGKFLIAR